MDAEGDTLVVFKYCVAQVPFAVEKLDRLVFIAVALRPFRPLRPVRPTVSTGKPVVQTVLSTVSLLWHGCRK